ncbi:Lhr family helicase [Botrimarina hoheduenensis]|uniref:Lhr family helicase n=1 Tax=Botrimarina hoheduenensis TaxID=2528000 RepID=UPI0018D467CA|nr:DEAD/DEAH box helicase [Botrimarina hoheduenensis]
MTLAPADALASFHEPTRTWFAEAFAEPTRAQQMAWPAIASGESTLLLAPTGSGKTLAAFLASLDRLMFAPRPAEKNEGVRVLYISPLKALGVDIDRNLRAPLAGMRATAGRLNFPRQEMEVAVRTGDTDPRERTRMVRHPPEVLITTPESLYLMLTSKARDILTSVETVILDEIHVMVPTKRGVHLFLTLERLERLRRQRAAQTEQPYTPLQRVGLSATQRPLDEIARLLGGAEASAAPDEPVRPRPVRIVDASEPKRLQIRVEMPVEDLARQQTPTHTSLGGSLGVADDKLPRLAADADEFTRPRENPFAPPPGAGVPGLNGAPQQAGNTAKGPSAPSLWPALHPRLLELIRQHRSTMIFVNSRRLAERLAAAINELAAEEAAAQEPHEARPTEPVEICLAHHGSVSKDTRAAIEDRLKRGVLPAIVATSSLELGIDMGAVDLVIQIEAPPSIASGVQRIGRSGRGVNLLSNGVIFPKYRGDLLACAGATGRMLTGHVEETYYPRNPLDLLAQQIVALVAEGPIGVDELYATFRGAAPYADLPRGSFEGVLDLLSGRYPSDEFAELRPRLTWDRLSGVVSPRKGTQRLAVLNGGTIPDRGLYGVFLVGDGPEGAGGSRVGELDEEMVFETHTGDVFLLGASSWRVLEITKDKVLVAPAPGEPGKMPFWRGDGPGRPLEFGKAIGELARELTRSDEAEATERLTQRHALDDQAADTLLRYLRDQAEATGEPPSDRTVIVESFLDEIGDWRVCVLSPLGSRVHAPWALAVASRLREEELGEVDYSWTDDGIVFRLPESPAPPAVELFVPRSDEVEERVTSQLGSTAMFAARFRENAARALLLPKRQPGRRSPLWMQRRKAADLLAVAARYPSFPILLETYRECLRDVFDLPGLVTVLRGIEQRSIRVEAVVAQQASPFAASLLFNYIGNFIYEGDAPLAERRAQALTLDHAQLRELLGGAELRELLDGEVIDTLGLELQKLADPYTKDADGVHDLLLSLGDLTEEEVAARCDPVAAPRAEVARWLHELSDGRRAIAVRVAGETRYAAAEDAARLRDALGVNPPAGLPTAFLESVADPLGDLISRYARTHGPFVALDAARRFGLGEAPVRAALQRLGDAGRVVEGEFLPGRRGREWCDAGVLRTIKRRSLARLRSAVEAAPAEAYARFLPVWQGVAQPRRGLDGVLDAVELLQGAPLPMSALESEILPTRVQDYRPGLLDELFHAGEILWQGIDSLGTTDGRIALYLADSFGHLGRMTSTNLLPRLASGARSGSLEGREPLAQSEGGFAVSSDEADPLVAQLRALFAERGALFFDEVVRSTRAFANDVLAALWRLVWQGEVTNDTLAPLRSLVATAGGEARRTVGAATRRGRHAFRSRRATRLPGSEGRWSLLAQNELTARTPTERLMALAQQLVQRHGILTRDQIAREQVEGGFSAIYPVLKAMEESGKLRRGYFVEGQGAAQFAAAGADELLRAKPRDADQEPATYVLAATDPASPFGAALPWPERPGDTDTGRPQRAAGALVIISDGAALGFLSRTGTALTTFLSPDEPLHTQQAQRLARALAERAARRSVLLEKVDGTSATGGPLAGIFAKAGFTATTKGLLCRSDFMAGRPAPRRR